MIQNKRISFILLAVLAIMISSCATKKRQDEVSGFKKFYHTFTSKYNGYFNANELMGESFATLELSRQDNYNQLLPVYTYVDVDNPKMVASQLDLAIEKVIRVATIHEVGDYVDDCYVLMGKAQYLKQDYETAQETFEFFEEEFNPANPYGSNYKKKKKTSKQKKKEREIEKKNQKEEREKEKEEKQETKRKEREAKEKAKKEAKKQKDEERKLRKKEKEEEQKRRKKEREAKKKNRKKGKKRSGGKKKREKKEETKQTEALKEEVEETKVDPIQDGAKLEEIEEALAQEDEKEVVVAEDDGEKEYMPKKKDEKKKDETAYSEGMLWLAKTYIEREKYSNAEYLLRKLSQTLTNDEVSREVPVAKAHLYIAQKEYDKAIPELRSAIDIADDGKLKARYAYIIAQLYQKKKDYANALKSFQEVKDHNGNFRMDFNADLSIAKNGLLAGTDSNDQASKKINKMLKEEKYAEFRDQIYFTLGEISLAQKNDAEALNNFTLSIRNNNNNLPLKSEAYYYMATLNFDKEEYVDAKYYYDSTLISMNKLDERYSEVSLYAKNLSRIASNIETIELQDSLLALSNMSQDELDKLADKLVLEQRAASDLAEEEQAGKATKKNRLGVTESRQTSRNRSFGQSNFFAYNLPAKQKGVKAFNKRWGDRKLEDNWRRASSQSYNSFDEEGEIEEEEAEITDAERKRALSDIPGNPAALEKANAKIEEALYDLGVAFRGAVRNYQKSADALEKLVVRYPQSEKILDAYYYLYLSYTDLSNSSKADYYRNKIIKEFPDSKFAKALQDPNYLDSLNDENNSVELYYNNTYALFESSKYSTVKNRIEEVETLFGKENEMKAKFGLLSAMVTGAEEGKEGYIKALQDVITRFPNTPQKIRAQEIMRFLKGDSDAFDVVEIKEVDDIFDFEEDKLHYVAVVVYESDNEKFTDAKISVSNFNKKFFKTKKLQISDIFLNRDEGSQIILVRKFKNMKESMDYFETIEKNKGEYVKGTEIAYDVYPITQRNYRKIISERSASKYRVFFEKNYKKK